MVGSSDASGQSPMARDERRCVHELLPGQCGLCIDRSRKQPQKVAAGKRVKAGATGSGSGRDTAAEFSPGMRRYKAALRAQERGGAATQRERKRLAAAVTATGNALSKEDRKRVHALLAKYHREASARGKARAAEDRLAGILRPRAIVQNVGRGRG